MAALSKFYQNSGPPIPRKIEELLTQQIMRINQSYQSRTGQRTVFITGMVRTGTRVYLGTVSDLPQLIFYMFSNIFIYDVKKFK